MKKKAFLFCCWFFYVKVDFRIFDKTTNLFQDKKHRYFLLHVTQAESKRILLGIGQALNGLLLEIMFTKLYNLYLTCFVCSCRFLYVIGLIVYWTVNTNNQFSNFPKQNFYTNNTYSLSSTHFLNVNNYY